MRKACFGYRLIVWFLRGLSRMERIKEGLSVLFTFMSKVKDVIVLIIFFLLVAAFFVPVSDQISASLSQRTMD
jgi:hypothetical protein